MPVNDATALFIRLLDAEDHSAALSAAIASTRNGELHRRAFAVNPNSFRRVPGSPFAYWVSERIRAIFSMLPRFESAGRVARLTNGTRNDARWIRAWWEVLPTGIGRLRGWVPHAKGGAFAPFYADVHLLIGWDEEEQTHPGYQGTAHRPDKRPASLDYFFRPGLTWTRRTLGGFSVRVLPGDCIFGDKGPGAFVHGDESAELLSLAAIMNSVTFGGLLTLQMAAGSYEVGVVQRTPVPELGTQARHTLAALADEAYELHREWDQVDETTHVFCGPALAMCEVATVSEMWDRLTDARSRVTERIHNLQKQIDGGVAQCYGLHDLSELVGTIFEDDGVEVGADEAEEEVEMIAFGRSGEIENLVMWAVGVAFGRWDVRVTLDPSLAPALAGPFDPLPVCSPGMLVAPNGIPAMRGEVVSEAWMRARSNIITLPPPGSIAETVIPDDAYTLRIDWDGILVDDPDHPDDVARRIRDVLTVIWTDRATNIEHEITDALGVRSLTDYVRKPAGFFAHHLQRYSKSRRQAPIYWPLSTASTSYTLWLYYHRLTSDTLYTAVTKYVEPKMDAVRREVAELETELGRSSGSAATRLRGRIEDQHDFLDELDDFRAELLRVAALPYRPNLDDGVIINAAPLWKLFRLPKWAKATRECWQKLEKGDYYWAHLAYQIWPDRVREKCRTDCSLAIAHDLEELYEGGKVEDGSRKARRRQAALIEESDE